MHQPVIAIADAVCAQWLYQQVAVASTLLLGYAVLRGACTPLCARCTAYVHSLVGYDCARNEGNLLYLGFACYRCRKCVHEHWSDPEQCGPALWLDIRTVPSGFTKHTVPT